MPIELRILSAYQARSEPLGQGGVEKYFVDFCRSAKEPFSGGSGGPPPEKIFIQEAWKCISDVFQGEFNVQKMLNFYHIFFNFVKKILIFDHFSVCMRVIVTRKGS